MKVLPYLGTTTSITIENKYKRTCALTEQEQIDLLQWFKNNKPELIYPVVCGNCEGK